MIKRPKPRRQKPRHREALRMAVRCARDMHDVNFIVYDDGDRIYVRPETMAAPAKAQIIATAKHWRDELVQLTFPARIEYTSLGEMS
jgi:hypothetical protein